MSTDTPESITIWIVPLADISTPGKHSWSLDAVAAKIESIDRRPPWEGIMLVVRLAFLAAVAVYLGLQTLFVPTAHTVAQGRHIFTYSTVDMVWAIGFNIIPLATALFLWRVKKDKAGAAIFLLVIPVFAAFVLPQIFIERTEITPTHLIHRREPPHSRFNADIAFSQIASAVELQRANGNKGFLFMLKSGRVVEFPSNTVITAASTMVAMELRKRQIPLAIKVAPSAPQ